MLDDDRQGHCGVRRARRRARRLTTLRRAAFTLAVVVLAAAALTACGGESKTPIEKAFSDASKQDSARAKRFFARVQRDGEQITTLGRQLRAPDAAGVSATAAALASDSRSLATTAQSFDSARLRSLSLPFARDIGTMGAQAQTLVRAARSRNVSSARAAGQGVVGAAGHALGHELAILVALRRGASGKQLGQLDAAISRLRQAHARLSPGS